jgi:hypothetical protein
MAKDKPNIKTQYTLDLRIGYDRTKICALKIKQRSSYRNL